MTQLRPPHKALKPGLIAALVLFYLLFGLLITVTPAEAQQTAPSIELVDVSAVARYKVGVRFNIKARANGANFDKLSLRVRFGKKGEEQNYQVDFNPGKTLDTGYDLYRSDVTMPTGVPLYYVWTAHLTNGNQTNTPERVVYYQDGHRWGQFEGGRVTVRWYAGDNDYGNLMYKVSTDVLTGFEKRFKMPTSTQIYVNIYASDSDFFEAVDGKIPAWAGGITYPEYGEILLVAPQDEYAGQYVGYGIPHELSHAVVYQFVGRNLPHWLDEGFAVYNQNRINPDYLPLVKDAAFKDRLLSFESISRGFPADSASAKLAYAQSLSFVDFLIAKFGDAAWTNLLDQLRTLDTNGAIEATYGLSFQVLQDNWRKYITGQPISLPKAKLTGAVNPYPTKNSVDALPLVGGFKFELILIGIAVLMAMLVVWWIIASWVSAKKQEKLRNIVPTGGSYTQVYTPPPSYQPIYTPPPPPFQNFSAQPAPLVTPPPEPVSQGEMDPLDIILAKYKKNHEEP